MWNDKKNWIIAALAILLLVSLFLGLRPKLVNLSSVGQGAPGTNAIENYIPAILYNGGYYSAYGIQTTSTLAVGGATTLSSTLGVTGATTLSSTLTGSATSTIGTNDLVVQTDLNRVGVGTTTPKDIFHVENQTGTSTEIISTKAANKGGRIILEDHDGAGCSEIAVLNGTLATKTVTCPTGI